MGVDRPRTEHVHADLIGNYSGETGSDIVTRWGTMRTGRFAVTAVLMVTVRVTEHPGWEC